MSAPSDLNICPSINTPPCHGVGDSELRADYYGSINMRRDPRTWRDGWQTVERPAAIWLVYGAQSLFKHIKMKPQDGLHVVFLADKDMDIPVHR